MKTITIKLTKAGVKAGPFTICDQNKNIIAEDVPKETLISGISYNVDDSVQNVTIKDQSKCGLEVTRGLQDITRSEYNYADFVTTYAACLWTHLKDKTIFNSYYGFTEPYIIEYPFAYQYKDEIVQYIESYDKVFRYYPSTLHSSERNNKVLVDDEWFNKAILYNSAQNTGMLILNPKPQNNMQEYMKYPKFNTDSMEIMWTKSDGFYQYNTFWNKLVDRTIPMFEMTCTNMSIDKVLNQDNYNYTHRAFYKAPLRAKDLRVRHILDDKDDITIVTQFIISPSQISYK